MKPLLALASALALVAGLGSITLAADTLVSVRGEVVDTYCYTTMGAKGASHRQCALTCAKKGTPIAILEDGSNKLFVLLPSSDKSGLSDAVAHAGDTVTITGHEYTSGGSQFLTVDSLK